MEEMKHTLHYIQHCMYIGWLWLWFLLSVSHLLHCYYIIGSNVSCFWRPFETQIRKQMVDELSEFTWFNVNTCTSGQRLKTPWRKSETSSSVSIVSIRWWLLFLVEWNKAWKNKNNVKLQMIYSSWGIISSHI